MCAILFRTDWVMAPTVVLLVTLLQSPPDSGLSWSSSLKRFMPWNVSAYLVPPTSNFPNTSRPAFAATGSEWVRSCDHWVLRVNSFKMLPHIRRICNGLVISVICTAPTS
ncbi:hypothetical protein BD770DRAFT_423242 [Pilaira anomala]|nr:hypothetical protein BD770DRAFT_423242 [Pilaira anomala]